MTQPRADVESQADGDLLEAARRGDAAGTRSALAQGANVEAVDASRRTALTLAVISDFVDVARVLVEHGASPNALDAKHDTPWLLTGETGSVAMVEVLLPGTPDFTIVNRFGGARSIKTSREYCWTQGQTRISATATGSTPSSTRVVGSITSS